MGEIRLLICRQLRGPLRRPFWYRRIGVSQDTGHGRSGDVISTSQLTQALSAAAIAKHGIVIEIEWASSDMAAFEPGATHAGADPLDDQVALELGDGSDNDDDSTAQRTAGVDLLAIADELDVEAVQLIEDLQTAKTSASSEC